MPNRQLKLDMDVVLHRANDSRRWILRRNGDKWEYRRIVAGQETPCDIFDYEQAKAKRFESESEIAHARADGWR